MTIREKERKVERKIEGRKSYMDEGRKRRMTNKRQSERGRRWKKKKKDLRGEQFSRKSFQSPVRF